MAEPAQSPDAALFYLRHRQQIEEWAALRDHARGLVDRALRRLEQPLAAFAAEVGGQVEVKDLLGGHWPAVLVCLPGWRTKSVRLGVGVGWERGQVLVPGENEWAWVGAYLTGDNRVSTAVSERLARLADHHDLLSEPMWPVWRYVTPPAGPLDPARYAESVLVDVRAVWQLVVGEIGDSLTYRMGRGAATSADEPAA